MKVSIFHVYKNIFRNMSNIIDSIQLSGSSYDVRDKSATTVVEITQSEYDNLPSSAKTSNILYIITDGNDYYITSAQCQTQIDNSISGKQDTLSAGTGIDITDNVISCTGGGGGGVTTGEVQTMIDESISGKVDTTTYTAYTASTDTALSGKQETLVSGTNIKTINNQSLLGPGNIDIQGGGTGGTAVEEMTQAEYDDAASAGTLDAETLYIITDAPEINANEYVSKAENTVSATTIFVNYQDNFSNQDYGANIVKSVTFDYRGDKTSTTQQQAYFSIVDTNTWTWYNAYAYFNYTDGTYTKDDSNNILDVTYDSSIEDFKVTISANYPNCNMSNVQFYGGYIRVPFSTIASGQSANVIQTSIANIFGDVYSKNLNNITNCYFSIYSSSNKNLILSYSNGRNSGIEGGRLYLEDLKAENRNGQNYLSSDINIPLGTSGWTEVTNLSQDACNTNYLGDIKPFTSFRISGDTSDFSYWSLQLAVGNGWNYSWDNIQWDENENTFVRGAGWSPDVFSAATVNWDSNTGYLTISYPDTFILDGQERQTEIYYLQSNSCAFGSRITKFEYYAEQTQPIKSYVQDTKQDLGGLKLVKLTESEYTALVNKDANTLYVVTPDPNS